MYRRISRAVQSLHRGEKGMTGLETAIILIAFVTVASVMAYAVLTAGVFAAERGKETVYRGLEQARSTMQLKSSVLGLSPNETELESVQFNVSLAIPNDKVDSDAVVVNYWDSESHTEGVDFTFELAEGSTERGAENLLENDEQFTCTITIPASANVTAYGTFSVEVLPPAGAALQVRRTLPGAIQKTMNLP